MTHLDQEVACWGQKRSREGKMRNLPSDWLMGWAVAKGALEESGWRTGSVGDEH